MATNLAIQPNRRNGIMHDDDRSPATPEITDDMRLGLRLLAKLARLAEQACQSTGISLPQYRLLSELTTGPSRASTMAARLGVSRPTLTSLVNGLEHLGLLARARVPSDRRGIALETTDSGRLAVARAETALAERFGGLASPAHMTEVAGLARHMTHVLAQQSDAPQGKAPEPRVAPAATPKYSAPAPR
ncbi:MAG: MarR family transcriptional regulator [Myxococcota bacterium]|nr:MarR family transcriptional regulator [Myxococcota bacterium]